MDYLKVNYYKLLHLKVKKHSLLILLLLTILIFSIWYLNTHYITKRIESYGVYDGLVLKLVADKTLSEAITKGSKLSFKDKVVNYEVSEYGPYEMVNNTLYQEIDLILDDDYVDNEAGEVVVYYGKIKIITFILELFK